MEDILLKEKNNTRKMLSFWSWNAEIKEEEAIFQLEDMKEKGFGGVFIHARAGLETEYLGMEWFNLIKAVTKRAENIGMEIWIYDENAWPSGFAGGIVNSLGESYQIKNLLISETRPDVDEGKLVAVYKNTSGAYQLTDKSDNGDLYFYYTVEEHYVDLLNKKVTEEFIKSTHEKYKIELGDYFGKTIKGIFTDEPQLFLSNYTWSFEFPEKFRELNGYSLLEKLYLLKTQDDGYEKFRHDYFKTIENVFTQSYIKPIFDWCTENNLLFTGHMSGEDSILHQTSSSGGVMSKYKYFHVPGIDHLGRRLASPVLIKQASSVARQMGYKEVLSETFGCSGWNTGFDDFCKIWSWQAALGINLPCLHLSAYTIEGIRKRDYPGFFSYQQPWWNNFGAYTNWSNELNKALSMGEKMIDTLVLNPIRSIWCDFSFPYNNSVKNISNQYRGLIENLIDVQVDFDLGDEEIIASEGKVLNGYFEIGKCKYKRIIVPYCKSIERTTLDTLTGFIAAGGEVVLINDKPTMIEGDYSADMGVLEKCAVIQNKREFLRKYFDCIHYNREISIFENNGFHLAGGLVVSRMKTSKKTACFVVNKVTDAKRRLIVETDSINTVYKKDFATGLKTRLKSSYNTDKTFTDLTIEGNESVFLEFEPGRLASDEAYPVKVEYPQTQVTIEGDNTLTIDYGSFSINGSEFSEKMSIISMHDLIYKQLSSRGKTSVLEVKYQFNCDFKKIPDEVSICAENRSCEKLLFNGIELNNNGKWWVDKSIKEYNSVNLLKNGLNEIIVTYIIPHYNNSVDVNEIFETERNRFFYPVEPESIYIKGKFTVKSCKPFDVLRNCIKIKEAEFVLTDFENRFNSKEDLTAQGLWFYRGNAGFSFSQSKIDENEKIILKIEEGKAVAYEISINNEFIQVLINNPYELDITKYLTNEINTIEIKALGSNRNLLGPHHHIKGENLFVGVNTFKGRRGFEDEVVNYDLKSDITWTDNYYFTAFGQVKAGIYIYKKEL